jgi:hypothetical protein
MEYGNTCKHARVSILIAMYGLSWSAFSTQEYRKILTMYGLSWSALNTQEYRKSVGLALPHQGLRGCKELPGI